MKLRIEIPLPMPTWNRILAMHHFERMKLREYLHHAVSLSITHGKEWPTWTAFQSREYLTDLFIAEFFQLIRPNTSRKSDIRKLKEQMKLQSSKSKPSRKKK